jgi:hypothetical protein
VTRVQSLGQVNHLEGAVRIGSLQPVRPPQRAEPVFPPGSEAVAKTSWQPIPRWPISSALRDRRLRLCAASEPSRGSNAYESITWSRFEHSALCRCALQPRMGRRCARDTTFRSAPSHEVVGSLHQIPASVQVSGRSTDSQRATWFPQPRYSLPLCKR